MVRMGVQDPDERISSGEIVDPSLIVARAAAATSGALPPLVFGPIFDFYVTFAAVCRSDWSSARC